MHDVYALAPARMEAALSKANRILERAGATAAHASEGRSPLDSMQNHVSWTSSPATTSCATGSSITGFPRTWASSVWTTRPHNILTS